VRCGQDVPESLCKSLEQIPPRGRMRDKIEHDGGKAYDTV
jgi:hypothetical protein